MKVWPAITGKDIISLMIVKCQALQSQCNTPDRCIKKGSALWSIDIMLMIQNKLKPNLSLFNFNKVQLKSQINLPLDYSCILTNERGPFY